MFAKTYSMRKKIVAGNWKMNLNGGEAKQLASEVVNMVRDEVRSDVQVLLFPPFVYLAQVAQLIPTGKHIFCGAQNCSSQASGAFTGEVSASMIDSIGGKYVILGHSERRQHFNETNEQLAQKILRAFESNLVPVYCCGELKEERESGRHFSIVSRQIEEGLFHIPSSDISRVIIAYEPVWAIGTGLNATPDQAQEMHLFIRNLLSRKYGSQATEISILYGGSCNEQNAAALFSLPDIDGGLIGGASLKSRSFVNIIKSMH
jgi:triosephosphate isomerase